MPRKFDFISPGIEITEVDQSILPAEVDDDGPIIIGRTARGPAMKPVKVRSLEDYVSVFGLPIPGGNSKTGDVWRDGAGTTAPSYASYAAQTWLASQTSPVTMVRLLGEDSTSATLDSHKAGWMLKNTYVNSLDTNNSTAYGLFVTDYANVGELTYQTITLTNVGDDTKQVTIEDSFSTSVEFRFNAGTGVTETNSLREIVIGGSAAATAAVLATKIEEAITLGLLKGIVVSYDAGETIINVATTHKSTAATVSENSNHVNLGATGANNLAVATQAASEGALAAIFYCNEGSLGLVGTGPGATGFTNKSCALVKSAINKGFTLRITNASSAKVDEIPFNFDRNSEKYIRRVFNTNPTLTNSTTNSTTKTYWLGETFYNHLNTYVTGNVAAQQYGVLVPLHENGQTSDASNKKYNWGYRKEGAAAAQSGWVIADDAGAASDYQPISGHTKMFKFHCLHEGETVQKEILIAVEDLKLPVNPSVYAYSTFTIRVTDINGNTLEKFTNLNMDADSNNYIAKRIGDMNQVWNESDRRYRKEYSLGFLNQSDYIRVEMAPEMPDRESALPFGFLGPGRPKGWGAVADDKTPKSLGLDADFTGAFVKDGDPNDASSTEFLELDGVEAVKFVWPAIPLRINGTDGYTSNPYKAYFGIRPKFSTNSKAYDPDYCDYLRRPPQHYQDKLFNPSGDWEHSFIFSLDDIVIDEDANTVTYTSGSRQLESSFTAQAGKSPTDLLKKGVSRFMMPLFGGNDGFDIQEREPFRFALVESAKTATDSTNPITYTLNKAIDSVADSEQVPANLLVMPGIKSTTFTDKLIATAESRQDCLAIIDLEDDYLPKCEAAAGALDSARRGSVDSAKTSIKARNFDSSYACAFYPWIQVRDTLNAGKVLWVPSSIAALGAMARTEATSDLWFAPAGFNRGGLGSLGGRSGPVALQATQRLDVSERDDLYALNVNPIASFPNEGLVIFGQKTLQSADSALDRINVRRLMIFLKRKIGDVAKATLFENNVEATWADFRGRAEPILSQVKNRFGLTEYRLILDETTTTPDLQDRNILYAKIFLKPARAIEFIAIDFVITKSGADFV
jgi:phage tail sheath protein FI